MFTNWLRRLAKRLSLNSHDHRRAARRRSMVRLSLERLEERINPIQHDWIGLAGNHLWSDDRNWTGGSPFHDPHIQGSGVLVTFGSNIDSTVDADRLQIDQLIFYGSGNTIRGIDGKIIGFAQDVTTSKNIWAQGTNNEFDGSLGIALVRGTPNIECDFGCTLGINGRISDTGTHGFLKTGPGTLLLQGHNTYTGTTTVNQGILIADSQSKDDAIPGDIVIGPGTGAQTVATVQVGNGSPGSGNNIADNAKITVNSDGLFDVNGEPETIGQLIVNDGLVRITKPAAGGSNPVLRLADTLHMTGGTIDTGINGTLRLGGDVTATSSAAGTATITGGGGGTLDLFGASRTFTVPHGSQAFDLEIDVAVIGNALGVTKNGTGVLYYHGDNTYTGTTQVNDGLLEINAISIDAAIVGPLVIGDGVGAAKSAEVRQISTSENIGINVSVTVNSDGLFNINGLQETIGPLTVVNGYVLSNGAPLLAVNGDINMTGGVIYVDRPGVLRLGGNVTATTSGIFPAIIGSFIGGNPGKLDLNGATRTFTVNNTASGSPGALLLDNYVIGGSVGVIKDGPGVMSYGNPLNFYTGGTQVKDGTLNISQLAIPGDLTVGDGNGGTETAVVKCFDATAFYPNAHVSINSDGLLDLNSKNQSINTLSVSNGSVTTGTATLSVPNGVGMINGAISGNGGTLSAGSLSMVGGSIIVSTVKLSGDVAARSSSTETARIGSGGTLDLGNTTRNFTVNLGTEAVDLKIDDVITGSSGAGLTKKGPGTLFLTNRETYTGTTTVNDGVVLLDGGGNTVIPGTLVIGDGSGTLQSAVVRETSHGEDIADAAAVTVAADGLLDLGGFVETIGPLSMSGGMVDTHDGRLACGALTLGAEGRIDTRNSGSLLLAGDLTVAAAAAGAAPCAIGGTGTLYLQSATRTFNVAGTGAPVDLSVTAVIADGTTLTGGIVKAGSGVLDVFGTNIYSGTTSVNAGTLIVDNASSLGKADGSAATGTAVANTASLVVGNVAVGNEALLISGVSFFGEQTTGVASWAGSIGLTNNATIFSNGDFTLSGPITGSHTLTKGGTGTLRLAAATNQYAANIANVTATGTLLVNSVETGTPVSLSAATFGGTGTVGNVTATGGTIDPGDGGPGTLTTAALSLQAGTTFSAQVNGTTAGAYDQVVADSVNLGGATLSVTANQVFSFASFTIISNTGSAPISGTFANLAEGAKFTANGNSFAITYKGGDGNDVVISNAAAPSITSANNATFSIGVVNDFVVTTSGNPTPTLSYTGNLPSGVTFNTAAGEISGTPAANTQGQYSLTIKAHNVAGNDAVQNFTLTVSPALVLGPLSADTWDVNQPGFSGTIAIAGGTAPYSNLTYSNLGAGITAALNGSTITVSGTPNGAVNRYTGTIQVQDANGATVSRNYDIFIIAGPQLSGGPLNGWDVNQSGFNQAEIFFSGIGNFSLVSATGLPPGVSASVVTYIGGPGTFAFGDVVFSGTPTQQGTFNNIQITIKDGASAMQSASYSMTIYKDPSVGALSVTEWDVNQAGYNAVIPINDGTGVFFGGSTFTVTGLPAGLTFAQSSILSSNREVILSGTPAETGTFNVGVSISDSGGGTASGSFVLTIRPSPTLAALTPGQWDVNHSYSGTIAIADGVGPFSNLSVTGLPNGLSASLNGNTITVSGTPTQTGTFSNVQVSVADVTGATATQTETLTINAAPTLGALSPTTWHLNQSGYSGTIAIVDGTDAFTNLSVIGLPNGLSAALNGRTITISGAPTQAGVFSNVQVSVHDAAGAIASATYSLTIDGSPVLGPLSTTVWDSYVSGFQAPDYMGTIAISGGKAPYSNATISGQPNGLSVSVSGSTITVSGKPNPAGAYNVQVSVQDANGVTATQTYALTINLLPVIDGPVTPSSWTVNQPYNGAVTIDSRFGTAPYSNLNVTGLPNGLTASLSGNTIAITGTPTTAGIPTVHFSVQDATGATATADLPLQINAAPSLSSFTGPNAWDVFRSGYSGTLTINGGTSPFSVTDVTGLPRGLGVSVNGTTITISGTPQQNGTFNIAVTAQDTAGAVASQTFTLNVNTPLVLGNLSQPNWVANLPGYVGTISVSNGTTPYAGLSVTGLPTGLTASLSGSTITISGTPAQAGSFNFQVSVSDNGGGTLTLLYALTINSKLAITTASLPPWPVNASPYNQTIATAGGTTPLTFAISTGTLPTGLTLNASTGAITGTPTVAASSTFTVTVTDAIGAKASQTYTLPILPASFAYDPNTHTLTINGSDFTFAQATTADATGTHTAYTFTMDGVSETFPDTLLAKVAVNGQGGARAILITNDTYTDANNVKQETRESIALGSRADAGVGTLQKVDASGTPHDFLTLAGFPTSYAYVGRADGTVLLYGTAGVPYNGFVSAGNYSYVGGPGLFHLAQGAANVYGFSAGQPTDFAYHYAANAGSAYVVSGTAYSYMSCSDTFAGVTQSYFNVGVGFLQNTGVAKNPGQDFAYIIDSPGNDTFVGGTAYSYLFMPAPPTPFAEFDAAYGFALVFAQSFVGGADMATNSDPTKNILVGFHQA